MPGQLDRDAKALLSILVDVLRTANPVDPRTFITYSEALPRLRIPNVHGHAGRILQERGLDALASWAKESGVPAVTGLIVRDIERDPGQGYFRFYGKREPDDIPWWIEEIRRSKEFDWSPYLEKATAAAPPLAAPPVQAKPAEGVPPLTVASVARQDSRFFLKSEYGPLSSDWPVVAFTSRSLGARLQSDFRPEADFIVYTGTGGATTLDPAHRGRILSLVRIDTTEIHTTSDLIADHSWEWARQEYPGQWENCFEAVEGWNFVPFPGSREALPSSYPLMGQYPHRGGVLEITGADRSSLLKLPITPLLLRQFSHKDHPPADPDLLAEARRIANLIFARVSISGETVQRTAPERTAPEDLVPNIHALLQALPLVCYLCGGVMQIRPKNRLLQPSPDRVDSSIGDYGPENLRLAHLACNLGKNAASVEEFKEWLGLLRDEQDRT
jgi:hypothetical protein